MHTPINKWINNYIYMIGENKASFRIKNNTQPLYLEVSCVLRKEMSLLRRSLLVSYLIMNSRSVNVLCLFLLKMPMVDDVVIRFVHCNGKGRILFCLIECV